MKRLLYMATLTSALFASSHWGYSGHSGPEHWGDLNKEFIMCKIGKNQSPVDITNPTLASLKSIDFKYKSYSKNIVNNGHSVQVNIKEGSYIKIDNKKFYLLQYHFHTPSENSVDGKLYPMEMHLVHKAKDGSLAVVAIFFKEGKENKELNKIIKFMPREHGEKMEFTISYPANFIPLEPSYYRFNGSLTTPPCSEGVRWFVLKEPLTASKSQLNIFRKVLGKNNRPVQPLNARLILE